MPKISIIVPCYNVEKYIKQCLDSIINQTLQDIEIICINDGSKDSTLDILKEYAQKDGRIQIIDKENSGYGASMNAGLDKASGEYIGIIESDDFAEPDMFENLYNIAKDNDADIVKSFWYNYRSTPKIVNDKIIAFDLSKTNTVINISTNPEILTIQPSIWSAIYRQKLLTDNNIRFLETPGASFQDTSFAFKATICSHKFIITDKAYVHYRQDNENSSINSKGKVYAICGEYDEIEKFLESNEQIVSPVNAKTYKWVMQYLGYTWNAERISPEFQKEFVKKFSDDFKFAYNNNLLNRTFFDKIKKRKIDLLVKNPKKYYKKYILKQNFRTWRKKLISLRISKKGCSFVLFGKTILKPKEQVSKD